MESINWAKDLGIPVTCFTSMDNIKFVNQRAGFYFFSKDAMRFFNSRILDGVYADWKNPDCEKFYFVTSEKGPDRIRRYSVREFNSRTGRIETANEFQAYKTSKSAKRLAQYLATLN